MKPPPSPALSMTKQGFHPENLGNWSNRWTVGAPRRCLQGGERRPRAPSSPAPTEVSARLSPGTNQPPLSPPAPASRPTTTSKPNHSVSSRMPDLAHHHGQQLDITTQHRATTNEMHGRRICTSRRPKAMPPRHHPLRGNLHLGVAGTGRIHRAPASLQCAVVPAGPPRRRNRRQRRRGSAGGVAWCCSGLAAACAPGVAGERRGVGHGRCLVNIHSFST
jgi:hypothetical protein